MNQITPFDISKAGTIHNFCLDNVRRGYGIANKYASAWEAWQHTEQHSDRDMPDGCDVPLFYSYTANIDGSTQNYGHINVRLKDGTVWSDGTIYANIDAYLENHTPQYVGWGESVNDVKIIEGEQEMKATANQVYYARRGAYAQDIPVDPNDPDIGEDYGTLVESYFDYANKNGSDYLTYKTNTEKQLADLKAQLASTPEPAPVPPESTPVDPPVVPDVPLEPVSTITVNTPPNIPTINAPLPRQSFWQRFVKAVIGEK